MSEVALATTDLHRKYGKLPHFRLTNGFIEEDKTNGVNGTAWLQRPGLSSPQTIGSSGTIRLMWRQKGAFSGSFAVITGASFYRLEESGTQTLIGSIPGTDYPVVAGGIDKIIIVSEGVAYYATSSTFSTITMPAGELVSTVIYINGYFLLPVLNTQKVFWIAPGGTNPNALDYFSCERVSDNIITGFAQGDTVWFLKQTNEEVWVPTGTAAAPFQRVTGRFSTYGCIARNSACACGPANAWVSIDAEIVVADGTPQVVSSPSDSEALRTATNLRSWYFSLDGHRFYILTTDIATFVVDLSTGSVARYNSFGFDYWRAHLGAVSDRLILAGDSNSNTVWTVDPEASNDNGQVVTREVTGFVANVGEPVSCDSISLNVDAGWSPSPTFEPTLQMRFSDDQGNTWSSWKAKGLGLQGYYGKDVTFRSLGSVVRPGRLFQFRMTDNARFRLSYARMNEV